MTSGPNRHGAVAVVGAGISGLACARTLADHGLRVRVFDKGRGVGGRMSTRRVDAGVFDHGAQYFTVRDPQFARAVRAWRESGLVAEWKGEIVVLERGVTSAPRGQTERCVGVPAMNAICRHLAEDLDVVVGTRVERLERTGDRWLVRAADGVGLGRFDAAVVAMPASQAAALLAREAPGLANRARAAEIAPCWAALAAFSAPLELGFDGAFVEASPLGWVARNASKPGRPTAETWVLHATREWSVGHLESEREEVARQLLAALGDATGVTLPVPGYLTAHRWRYALPTEPLLESCLHDADLDIFACGDWCDGPRVEGAWLSGLAAARRLLGLR